MFDIRTIVGQLRRSSWVGLCVLLSLATGCGDEEQEGVANTATSSNGTSSTSSGTSSTSNSTSSTSSGTSSTSSGTTGGATDAELMDCGGGVMSYVVDPARHLQGGSYVLTGLEPLNEGSEVLDAYCIASDERVVAGREVAVTFTALEDGVHTFESSSPTARMAVMWMCNISRQFVECAEVPYHLDPSFQTKLRRVEVEMRAGDVLHVMLDSANSEPMDLTIHPPRRQGEGCALGDAQSGGVCVDGLTCVCGRGCQCGRGSAPELNTVEAWVHELNPGQARITIQAIGADQDRDMSGGWPRSATFQFKLMGRDGGVLVEQSGGQPVQGQGDGFEGVITFQGSPEQLQGVERVEVVAVDDVGNESVPLSAPVVAQEPLEEGDRCRVGQAHARCAAGLACLARDAGLPEETTCVAWEARAYVGERAFTFYVHAPEAAAEPSPAVQVSYRLASGTEWFRSPSPYVDVPIEDPARGWERKIQVRRDDLGIFIPPPGGGDPSEIWVSVAGSVEARVDIEAYPVRGEGERCDRDQVLDRCELEGAQGVCRPSDGAFVCGAAEAPTVTRVRWYGEPDGQTFGFQVEGFDPDEDMTYFVLERVDRDRETFLNAESASGVFNGTIDQFGVTELRQDGPSFSAGWSIVDWPFSYLPQSVAWRLTLLDREGLASAPVYSDESAVVEAPDVASLGEPCDPHGLRSVCGDVGAVCDRRYQGAEGFVCREAQRRCPDAWPLVRLEEQGSGLWVASGSTLGAPDVASSTCFARTSDGRPDVVLEFVAPRAGRYDAWVTSSGNTRHRIFARRLCALPHSGEVDCFRMGTATQVTLEEGESLYLFVEATAYQGAGDDERFEVSVAQP